MDTQPLDRLRTRTSIKWRAYPDDVLPLFIAELDFPLAEPIARALHDAIDRSDTGYAFPSRRLGEAFAAFASARWGWSVDPGQVASTTDVSVAIVESLRQVISPGDGVVINPPIYPPFFDLVPEAGGVVVEVPLVRSETTGHTTDAGGWSLDLPGLEAAFAAGARAYLLCNPHNPLGHPHSAEDLTAVVELAARYDVTVVSDEVHAPLTHSDGHFTPYLSVPGAAERGICVTSASKGWNLAGLKCALMVTASERMRERITTLPEEVALRSSQFGLIANIAAYEQGAPWLDEVVAALQRNRAFLSELLRDRLPDVGYAQPHASYLAWLDLRALGWGDDPSVVAEARAKVALSPGPAFGSVGRGFARLNFGCSPEVLTEAVTRLAAAR
ncbi:MalY/PatB family protein [Cryobacterium tepidiphilum]|uniref:cysteine-S-conjugate beta-lyase n=1 Tax=Cryobacterium tepidiphilum TaxID=2486026 RepID=A0A3M8LGD1_9MICO|nr:aminotransferase class I/II-fold pyridoxal phosphate-dependent enzyme [Cryobacterium tepidiphilum]RNE63979.1 aminotransferase class I/II-fold pyridoxal phosphate-dependent enzyme [Cryobacterium tepidiphilum]